MIKAMAEDRQASLYITGSIGNSVYEGNDTGEEVIHDVGKLRQFLKDNKDANTLDIYINSPGGDVFEGLAIYSILKRCKAYKRVYIDGLAASSASVIAMAGNSITMPKSSLMMIHNAWTIAVGNSAEFRKIADDLDVCNETIRKAYMTKFKGTEEELAALMDAESYLTADKCIELGLATKVSDDGEDTQEDVDNAIDQNINMYTNKLNMLASIKKNIEALTAETEDTETVKEPDGETVNEDVPVIEGGEPQAPETPNVVTEEEAEHEVEQVKQTALQKFFNYQPKGE